MGDIIELTHFLSLKAVRKDWHASHPLQRRTSCGSPTAEVNELWFTCCRGERAVAHLLQRWKRGTGCGTCCCFSLQTARHSVRCLHARAHTHTHSLTHTHTHTHTLSLSLSLCVCVCDACMHTHTHTYSHTPSSVHYTQTHSSTMSHRLMWKDRMVHLLTNTTK